MWSGSSVPFVANAWTTSSCGTSGRCAAHCATILPTITDRERISRWGRIHPSQDQFSRWKWDQLWCCRRSVGCTTATNDGRREQSWHPLHIDSTGLVILCSGSEKSMRHFPHNLRYCGKCFREIEEFLSYRVPGRGFSVRSNFRSGQVRCG